MTKAEKLKEEIYRSLSSYIEEVKRKEYIDALLSDLFNCSDIDLVTDDILKQLESIYNGIVV